MLMQFYLLLIYCPTAILNCYRSNKTCFVHFSLSADSFLHLMLPLPAKTALLFHGTATRIMIMHELHFSIMSCTNCFTGQNAEMCHWQVRQQYLKRAIWRLLIEKVESENLIMWKISEGKKRGEREEHKGIHPPPYSCVPLTLCTWRKGNIPDLPEIFQR